MNLEKLYKMQEELDNHILENARKRNVVMSEEELLDKTILALLVEVGELANATRCFKHWSTKGSESKERLLDELADIWHFYLSIGNQMNFKLDRMDLEYDDEKIHEPRIFKRIYYWAMELDTNIEWEIKPDKKIDYTELGTWIKNTLG